MLKENITKEDEKEPEIIEKYLEDIKDAVIKITESTKKDYKYDETVFGNEKVKEEMEIAYKMKQLQMKEGDLAQKVLGMFPEWEDLKTGHSSGLDIKKKDNSCIMEIKNSWNTCNSGSQKAVLDKLSNYKKKNPNTVCVWGIVNPRPNSKKLEETIIYNGEHILKLQGTRLLEYVLTYDGKSYKDKIVTYVKNIMY